MERRSTLEDWIGQRVLELTLYRLRHGVVREDLGDEDRRSGGMKGGVS